MSDVAKLIDLISRGNNTEAADVLNSELMTRSYQLVNDLKPEVARNYFAPVVNLGADGSVEYSDPDDSDELYDDENEVTDEDTEE